MLGCPNSTDSVVTSSSRSPGSLVASLALSSVTRWGSTKPLRCEPGADRLVQPIQDTVACLRG
jgi:hypothetical protein